MDKFLEWALPLLEAETQEECLHWLKVGHLDTPADELRKRAVNIWKEKEMFAKTNSSPKQ